MENYEEKYKDLIARLQKAKENDDVCDERYCCVIDEIAPELKESEDELTWLTKYIEEEAYSLSMDIRDNEDRIKYEKLQKALAWLEKQGESIKIKKGKNYLCTKTHKYAGVEWIKGTKYYASDNYTLVNKGCECYCPEYSKEEHNNFFKEVEYDGCLEKQGEQKVSYTTLVETGNGGINALVTKELPTNGCDDEQKPAWSEEDVNVAEDIEEAIRNYWHGDTLDILLDWLKSLKDRVQPIHEYSDTEKQEMFIRSLRPHFWRPSDKQMECLHDAINHYHTNGYPASKLNELYEQMSKIYKL